MKITHAVTLFCLIISLVLAAVFFFGHSEQNITTAQLTLPSNAKAATEQMSADAIEQANLIGIGVVFSAVIVVTLLAFFRKPAPSDDAF